MNIHCHHFKGYSWFSNEDTFVKGYLFDQNNELFSGRRLLEYFKNADPATFQELLLHANGFFSVIKKHQNGCLAGVDRLRSLPLFFTQKNNQIFISDDAFYLQELIGAFKINPLQESAFLKAGHTLGNATLIDGIQQLEAGQFIYFDENGFKIETYFEHLRGDYFQKNKKEHFEELNKISENIFQRLIQKANGRQLVVPLSGGYDSRYIVAMLKKLDYQNMVTYTYGMPFSYEVKIARKVATQLNFEWHFIEYPMDWQPYYEDTDFQIFASGLSSLPHEQDYLAVKTLKEKKLIAEDAIFVPGFCGDLLGGSVVPDFYKPGINQDIPELGKYVFEHQLEYENKIGKQQKKALLNFLNKTFTDGKKTRHMDEFIDQKECFFTKNMVSKYVVNSLRVYEYFGFEWSMPLWDNELIEYWYQVPNEERVGEERLYHQFLLEGIFLDLKIDYLKPKKRTPNSLIKDFLGKKIMTMGRLAFVNSPFYKDINGLRPLLEFFQQDLKKAQKDSLITTKANKIMAAWYVYFLEKYLADRN